ncbi:acyl-CoA thioesterase [Spartinivicinus poritis]|uniref:Thioesterase family protein n=1 Tax=Spartinivicinus poritis TaxID=2994640 RepID=A0ABT5U4B0_9GAMM|nr:thioesterase family protein [Spartinivicinus sp. A2-2]MDE1461196.1 thioesterase family protein [Spartinivicinus sp. A2-2]
MNDDLKLSQNQPEWDLPTPFILDLTVDASVIDHYGHVNNTAYVSWLQDVSWAHSNSIGLTIDQYRELNRAMVVHRHEIDYLAPAFSQDKLQIATWVVMLDNKLTLTRQFQIIRPEDQRCILRANTKFVCVELSSGKPRRMPELFIKGYSQLLVKNYSG